MHIVKVKQARVQSDLGAIVEVDPIGSIAQFVAETVFGAEVNKLNDYVTGL
jgi:hypothetical protein